MSLIPTPAVTAERAQMETDLAQSKANIETMRQQETKLRELFVQAFRLVQFNAGQVAHRAETRQWNQASLEYLNSVDLATQAESALLEVLSDITYEQVQIDDMQRTLDNNALWSEVA